MSGHRGGCCGIEETYGGRKLTGPWQMRLPEICRNVDQERMKYSYFRLGQNGNRNLIITRSNQDILPTIPPTRPESRRPIQWRSISREPITGAPWILWGFFIGYAPSRSRRSLGAEVEEAEAVLAGLQVDRFHDELVELGFKPLLRWRNPNSGNYCVYYFKGEYELHRSEKDWSRKRLLDFARGR